MFTRFNFRKRLARWREAAHWHRVHTSQPTRARTMADISEDATQAIFDCARGSDVAALKALLARHGPAAVAVTDVEGSTPLHVACSGSGSGSVDIVAALVEAGADVDGVDEGAGFTPLVQAVEADYTGLADIIAYLVSTAGAGVNVPDAAGRTPFSHAAGLGQDATVSLLLRRGADAATPDNAGVTPVHHAVLGGQLGVLQHMQELGLPVDITTVDSRGRNALHHALRTKGNATSMLEWLLTLPGVDTALAARTKRGETPYMAAAKAFAKQLHEQAKDAKAAGGGIPLSAQLTIWPDTCGSMLLQAGADHSIPDGACCPHHAPHARGSPLTHAPPPSSPLRQRRPAGRTGHLCAGVRSQGASG